MTTDARRFILIWAAACVLMLGAVGAFNLAIDPYLVFGMPRVEGINKIKPAAVDQEEISKVYQLARLDPQTIVLGSSRSDIALDPDDTAWPAQFQPVFNASLAGVGSIYPMKQMLEHALITKSPKLVLIGLDFEYFLFDPNRSAVDVPVTDFGRRLNDVAAKSKWSNQGAKDLFSATLTLGALQDSLSTVVSNRIGQSADLSPSGHVTEHGLRELVRTQGQYELFAQKEADYFRDFFRFRRAFDLPGRENPAMRTLQDMLDLAAAKHVSVVLFIHPTHAERLEQFRLLGYSGQFSAWKRALVDLVAQYEAESQDSVTLWDFSHYSAYSEETTPARGDRKTQLKWFWEPTHYTTGLGHMVIEHIFGAVGPKDLGFRLTPETLPASLVSFDQGQETYRRTKPQEVERLQELFNRMSLRSRPPAGAD